MKHLLSAAIAAIALSGSALAQNPPAEWDGLVRVNARHFDAAYIAPGADFSRYTKVMIDPTEVAFRKNWLRDYNRDQVDLSSRLSEEEARQILQTAQSGFEEVFADAYRQAGYEVVTAPGPDVLRLRTAVTNLDLAAPDELTPGRVTTYAPEAGEATLVLEARDSMSGAILARGVDRREAGDREFLVARSRVTNRADFERMFRSWAQMSVEALGHLRATPAPAAAVGQP